MQDALSGKLIKDAVYFRCLLVHLAKCQIRTIIIKVYIDCLLTNISHSHRLLLKLNIACHLTRNLFDI
jgi:hypothetical protein